MSITYKYRNQREVSNDFVAGGVLSTILEMSPIQSNSLKKNWDFFLYFSITVSSHSEILVQILSTIWQ